MHQLRVLQRPLHPAALALGVLTLVFAAASCGGSKRSATVTRPGESQSATATARPFPSSTPTPSLGDTPVAGTPVTFSALSPLLQQVGTAVEGGDASTLRSLLHARPEACSAPGTQQGLGAGPDCPTGTAAGTLIGAFIDYGDCEGGGLLVDTAVAKLLSISAEHPQLVGWVAGAHDAPNNPMALDYLVFSVPVPVPAFGSSTSARAVGVDSTGIVSILMGCGSSPGSYAQFLVGHGGTVYAIAPTSSALYPACSAGELSAGFAQGSAFAGGYGDTYLLTDVGQSECSLSGFPIVMGVRKDGTRQQLYFPSAGAAGASPAGVGTVDLRPGDAAQFKITFPDCELRPPEERTPIAASPDNPANFVSATLIPPGGGSLALPPGPATSARVSHSIPPDWGVNYTCAGGGPSDFSTPWIPAPTPAGTP